MLKGTPEDRIHELRSPEKPLDYKKDSLLCGKGYIYGGKKKDFILIPMRTHDFKTEVLEADRQVKAWIAFVSDLYLQQTQYITSLYLCKLCHAGTNKHFIH